MAVVKPFRAIRPVKDKAPFVASRSYEEYSNDELRSVLQYNPFSFLHIVLADFMVEFFSCFVPYRCSIITVVVPITTEVLDWIPIDRINDALVLTITSQTMDRYFGGHPDCRRGMATNQYTHNRTNVTVVGWSDECTLDTSERLRPRGV